MAKRPSTKTGKTKVDALYRKAVASNPQPEDEDTALNRIADARSNEPRLPIERLFRKLGYELER